MIPNSNNYSIEESKEGFPTIAFVKDGKKIYLHSKFFPSREEKTLKDKFNPDKFDTLLVLGVGFGYHLLPLLNIYHKYKKIIILDALKNIEEHIKKNPLTGFLYQCENIIFISGKSINNIKYSLSELIDLDVSRGLNVIEHPPSFRIFTDYYSEIKKIIERIITKKAGNKATKKAFGMLFLKNIIKNINIQKNIYPISSFFNKMNNYPAIVIASGPSLDNYIDTIQKYQNKFFIISADSALPVLCKYKIKTDFILSIDPQPFIFEHFIDTDVSSSILILSISSPPILFLKFTGLLSLNTHPFSQLINALFPSLIGSIDSKTGTVAGDAINTAHLFGFNTIGLIGLDFSFPKYSIYAKGTAYYKRFINLHNRFTPVETFFLNYIMQSSKGNKYQNLFTRKTFINYKESIEEFIKKNTIKKIYNINNIGVPINLIDIINLDEFIVNYCNTEINKSEIIKKLLSVNKKIDSETLQNNLNDILKNNEFLNELLKTSLENDINKNKIKRIKTLLSGFSS